MDTTLKKKTEEKSLLNRTGILLARKRKCSSPRVLLAHVQKRSGEQIDDSILKEFFLACFTRTLGSLFTIKPCICFIQIRCRNISMFVMNAIHSSTHQTHLRLTVYKKRAFEYKF